MSKEADKPVSLSPDKSSPNYQMYLAGGLGALFLGFGDLLNNDTAATVLKIGAMIKRHVYPGIESGGSIGLCLLVLFGVCVCWIYQPKTRIDAFARGLSVFALLTVATPYQAAGLEQPTFVERTASLFEPASAHAQQREEHGDRETTTTATERLQKTNATIKKAVTLSSCKPKYSGIFALGSLINNTMEYCPGDKLKPGTRVLLLEHWDSGLRNYRYVKIRYRLGDEVRSGWLLAGKKPNYWLYITPDDENNPYATRGSE